MKYISLFILAMLFANPAIANIVIRTPTTTIIIESKKTIDIIRETDDDTINIIIPKHILRPPILRTIPRNETGQPRVIPPYLSVPQVRVRPVEQLKLTIP